MNQFYLNLIKHRLAMRACRCQRLVLDKPAKRVQQGFSLLELMVVVALISIVALASTSLIIDNGDLKRQEATETRWDQLHDAIISQPNLYLNGSPYIRGYVADMGRLPVGIVELISQTPTYDDDDDTDTAEVLIPYDEDRNAGTPDITIDQPDWQAINLYTPSTPTSIPPSTNGLTYTAELQGGWRGPYLYTAGSRLFRDGWGRESNLGLAEDSVNFGWEVDTRGEQCGEVMDLFIQSFGSDQDQDIGGSGDFTEDFPADLNQDIVRESEWTVSTSAITFNINFSVPFRSAAGPPPADQGNLPPLVPPAPPGAGQELVLRIFRYVDNGDNSAEFDGLDDATDDVEVITADAPFTVADGDPTTKVQTITPLTELPIGRYAALIYCTNNNNFPLVATSLDDDTVYDGDCNGYNPVTPVEHSPVYFTLTNNTSQVTLTWDLP